MEQIDDRFVVLSANVKAEIEEIRERIYQHLEDKESDMAIALKPKILDLNWLDLLVMQGGTRLLEASKTPEQREADKKVRADEMAREQAMVDAAIKKRDEEMAKLKKLEDEAAK